MASKSPKNIYDRWYPTIKMHAYFSRMPSRASEMMKIALSHIADCYSTTPVSTSVTMSSQKFRVVTQPLTKQIEDWSNIVPDTDIESIFVNGELPTNVGDITWRAQLTPHYGYDAGTEFSLELPTHPMRIGANKHLVALINALFAAFASDESCFGANVDADFLYERKNQMPLVLNELTDEFARADELWSGVGTSRRNYIPRVSWLTLLTPQHLSKLGGFSSLQSAIARWKNAGHVPKLLAIDQTHAAICLDEISAKGISMLLLQPGYKGRRLAESGACWESILRENRLLIGSDPASTAADLARWRVIDRPGVTNTVIDSQLHANADTPRPKSYYRNHPPSFLQSRCVVGSKVDFPQIYNAPNLVVHRIAMPGHSHIHTAWGVPSDYDYLFAGPLYIGGKNREDAFVVIDPAKVGHDASQGKVAQSRRRKTRQLRCPECWHEYFRFAVALEYTLTENEIAEIDVPAEELFTWLYVHAACANCKWRKNVLDFECA